MPADHHADELKTIYRELAAGRITDDQAQAAEAAVHGRRADRDDHSAGDDKASHGPP